MFFDGDNGVGGVAPDFVPGEPIPPSLSAYESSQAHYMNGTPGTGDLGLGGQEYPAQIDECYIYTGWRRNQTNLIVSGYEGIPQNLILNLICWLVMVTLFSCLRKKAWNYGRIALVERDRDDARWTTVFYGSTEAGFPVLNSKSNGVRSATTNCVDDLELGGSGSGSSIKPKSNGVSVSLRITHPSESETDALNPNGHSFPNPSVDINTQIPSKNNNNNNRPFQFQFRPNRLLRNPSVHTERNADTGIFNWIITAVTLSDEQFLLKSGSDAVQYLSFQRHLIFLGTVLCVCSLIIILPIHLQGSELRNKARGEPPQVSDFRQSTIMNLTPHSKLLWVHLLFSIIFLLLSILVMRHFSMSLKLVESELESISRTVIITGMSKHGNPSSAKALRDHFKEVYPTYEIDEISFAYDLRKLQKCWNLFQDAQRSQEYCERQLEVSEVRLQVTPYFCCCFGNLCSYCGIGVESMDAIEFYSHQVQKYYSKVLRERELLFRLPIGIAFVTFRNTLQAETVVRDYRSLAKWFHQTPESGHSVQLRSDRWTVHFAPVPNDINWENLSLGFKAWCFKFIIVNTILVLVICVYSTPVFILNWLNVYWTIKQVESSGRTVGGFLKDTLPTLLLWIAAVTLPSVVSVTDRMIGFWTKTAENRSRMIKTFTFLLFMVIILPSLGLTSLVAVVGEPVRWHCIFSSANGSFFVNYVITSCFIGTASELLRFPELFVYAFKLCFTRSSADISSVRKSVLWEFQIGSQYAWMMLNFGIFTLFSLVVPIITPFGLLYLIMKHYVDRYNIYFAYGPVKVDKRVHETAINFGILCMFLLQIVLLAFLNTRIHGHESSKPLQVFSIVGFCITGALFLAQVFFKICASFSPIHYYDKPSASTNPVPDTTDSKTTFRKGHSRNPSSTSTSKEGLPLIYVRQGPGQGRVGRRKRYCPTVLSDVLFDEEVPPPTTPGSTQPNNDPHHLQIPLLFQAKTQSAAKDKVATSQV